MEPDLRKASEADRDEIPQLLRDAFAPYMARLGRVAGPGAFDWFPQALAEGQVYVVAGNDGIEGVLVAVPQGERLNIKVVAVRPDLQGKGLGSRLLEEIESRARGQGFEALTLETAEIMVDMLRLYGRHGFHEVRRGPPDHGKDEIPRVFLRKDLQLRR